MRRHEDLGCSSDEPGITYASPPKRQENTQEIKDKATGRGKKRD